MGINLSSHPEGGDEGDGAPFSDINITPLTDIFLVLLIIFMVTSSVQVESASRSGVKVNLPKGSAQEIDPGQKALVVSVLKTGDILVQGQKVKPEDVDSLFQSTAAKDPNTQIIIEADQDVYHKRVVDVMESVKRSGLTKLGIRTNQ